MPSRDLDTATRAALLGALATLDGLRHVECVGERVEVALPALHGEGGIPERDVAWLVRAARRWRALDPRICAVLRSEGVRGCHPSPAACWALTTLLARSTRVLPVPAWVYGSLRREWIRLHGYAPPIELVPQSKEDTP